MAQPKIEPTDEERRAFIRAAAIQLHVAARSQSHYPPATVWRIARELWDAKPEDC